MQTFLQADTRHQAALQPQAAIGPAVRAHASHIVAEARAVLTDPKRSNGEAVHEFRRALKQWRALIRLLAPFIADATRWRREGRDHARTLSPARDGQAALNAFDDLIDKGLVLPERSVAIIRSRLEGLRASEEQAVLTPELREPIVSWLDAAAGAVELWPLGAIDFSAIAARLTDGYRSARRNLPDDWSQASAEQLHGLRRRVVDHRYQMELIEPLWPRFGRMWIDEAERVRNRLGKCQDLAVLEQLMSVHQPLARWRARLLPACVERQTALAYRAARIARRLFAERPKAFRDRLEALWAAPSGKRPTASSK
ncbi:MAG TPA: CHAD domain-containing protein [Xanthobacteraceae bacterium]|jgi:CHAD domain-containing protein